MCGGQCLCSLGRRQGGRERSLRFREREGWQGSCKTFSVFCPLFSCTLLSSGLFTLNSKVWFGSGQPEPSQSRRKSSPGCRSLKDATFSNSPRCLCAMSYHLEGISVRYFFHKITPHSVGFFFSLKSLLLLAEEHGRAIAVCTFKPLGD